MSMFSSVAGWFGYQPIPPVNQLKEAAGTNVVDDAGDDMTGWRRLSDNTDRNLNPVQRARMQKISAYLWQTNLIANRLIELPLAYLLAEGVTWTNPDDDHQMLLTQIWQDPINKMGSKLVKKCRELAIFGEQFYPAFVNKHSGFVRLGYLDPAQVGKIIFDPDNSEQPIGVLTTKDTKGQYRRYRVIINGGEDVFTDRTRAIREGFTDGDIFYFAINSFAAFGRGNGDLTQQADFLDLYDDFIFGEGERADALRAYVWDVTLKNADADAVNERMKTIRPPAPNSVNVHNDSEVWQSLSPDLKTSDTEALGKLFKNHMLSGATMPPHWFSDGVDVNRANGEGMAEPTLKTLKMRQTVVKEMLGEIATYALRQWHIARTGTEPDPGGKPEIFATRVEMPEMTAKDTTKYATALGSVVSAGAIAVNDGFTTRLTVTKLIGQLASMLGVEIDAAAELEKAAEELAERQAAAAEADVYTEVDEDE